MSEERINLETSIDNTLLNIENDIKEIASILEESYKAMLTLDENRWKAREKERIDAEFVPYLKKISEKYPLYITSKLNIAKTAVETYRNLDKTIATQAEKIEEII